MTKSWQDVNAIYQIYPRSFCDTNGDGVGDLNGIIEKLDYLRQDLGVDAVWLSPFYPSPQNDLGYDVSDYCGVDPLFGSLEDFKHLVQAAHDRDIKIMVDIVPNHTSDQHEWFKQSRASRDNPKRDYYVWRDPAPGGGVPNNWVSMSGGGSWEYDEATGQYYLHTFMKDQPDLNWDNPAVREEMKNVLRFWLDLGADGFRVDAVWPLSKDPEFRDDPQNPDFHGPEGHYGNTIHSACKCGPNLLAYLKEMSDVVASYPDRFIVFEHYPDDKLGDIYDQYKSILGVYPGVASSFFFESFKLPFQADAFRKALEAYYNVLSPGGRAMLCFGNHDQSRLATRFGLNRARLIAMLQMTLPGLPTMYYGEELGMEDVIIDAAELQDKFDSTIGSMGGRDPERTPMLWDNSQYAGFSLSQPWLPIGERKLGLSVGQQKATDNSFFALYSRLLELRQNNDALRLGVVKWLDAPSGILMYKVEHESEKYIAAFNFNDQPVDVHLPPWCEMLAASYPDRAPSISSESNARLNAYEAILVRVPGE